MEAEEENSLLVPKYQGSRKEQLKVPAYQFYAVWARVTFRRGTRKKSFISIEISVSSVHFNLSLQGSESWIKARHLMKPGKGAAVLLGDSAKSNFGVLSIEKGKERKNIAPCAFYQLCVCATTCTEGTTVYKKLSERREDHRLKEEISLFMFRRKSKNTFEAIIPPSTRSGLALSAGLRNLPFCDFCLAFPGISKGAVHRRVPKTSKPERLHMGDHFIAQSEPLCT
ncbi:hypothetical protein CEXT_286621 [Caerostris extrusa]|uniref:Uncharacterized protein n=1 Tax=Caerostris extrusa TaxID=172846 RepID=A0AAV4SC05_CAEEX|nr:hypothetical protein CEXT_286621 [Caerostris extrusa]